MKRTIWLTTMSFLLAGIALSDDNAIAQQDTLKEQLVGTWTVMSVVNEHKDGSKIETFGSDPKGIFMFDSDGHFSTHIIRSYRPKFAHRDAPTCAESKAVVEGTITAFGTYTVAQADHSISLHIIGSSFPIWDDTNQKRFITITGDELKYINPTPSTGGGTGVVVLKRAK